MYRRDHLPTSIQSQSSFPPRTRGLLIHRGMPSCGATTIPVRPTLIRGIFRGCCAMQRPHRRAGDKKDREIAASHEAFGDLPVGIVSRRPALFEDAYVCFGSKADIVAFIFTRQHSAARFRERTKRWI